MARIFNTIFLLFGFIIAINAMRTPVFVQRKAPKNFLKMVSFSGNKINRIIAAAALGSGLVLSPLIIDNAGSFVANADSTGKLSTKLTAKKRYLPRIKTGVVQFNKLSSKTIPEDVTHFVKEDAPGLIRAMDLYGVSLRKGEIPDEISRTAEKLTNSFAAEVKKLDGSKGDKLAKQLEVTKSAINDYLEFAKLSTTDSNDYLAQ